MLVSFSIANWRIFRDEVTFFMIATSEKQNKETVAVVPSIGVNILPVAAIYGGNASGKTSLVKGLAFMQDFILRGTLPDASINIEPFILDENFSAKPSTFKVQILVQDKCYELSFSADSRKIHEERLVQILKTTEKELYYRDGQKFRFNAALIKDKRLEFISQGTRENQLFLTNSVSQNIERQQPIFKSIYDWFKEQLTIILPQSQFRGFDKFMQEADPLSEKVNAILPSLDMGIVALEGISVNIDTIGLPLSFLQKLKSLSEGQSVNIKTTSGDMIVVKNENGTLNAKKLMAKHLKVNG